jgi:hypothetical protein
MTSPSRMQAYVSKQMGSDIIYLSLMLLTERTIIGYDIPDTHEHLVNLSPEERKKYRKYMVIEYKYRARMYIYEAMMKITRNGCLMAAHQFG